MEKLHKSIKDGHIQLDSDNYIYLSDEYIDKIESISLMKKSISKDKNIKIESDNFMDYKKSCQKSKGKRRKSK